MVSLRALEGVLKESDIEGLIEIGAPKDEYDTEAQMIAQKIQDLEFKHERKPSVNEIVGIIRDVWREMFGLDEQDLAKRQKAFEEVAQRLAP